MTSSHRLSLDFDPLRLQSDLQVVKAEDWVPHFNTNYFEGDWSGIALRSTGGDAKQIYPDPHAKGSVVDTPILRQCPNIRQVLESFDCPIRSARLLKLSPGSSIKEHRDYDLGFADGEIRLHIPIATEASVSFFLAGKRVVMREGECWYLDFSLPHRIDHRGAADRIHLVLDCVINDWLLRFFPHDIATASGRAADAIQSAPGEFEKFREIVLGDIELQGQLRETSDRESFIALVCEAASGRGYQFSQDEVREILQAARSEWIGRWIE
jgi:Aspartyl/Asparaginyl beta-hydroxylase